MTCDTISRNEVFVGRHHRCSRRLTANRNLHIDPYGILKGDVLRGALVLCLALTLAAICGFTPVASAQTPVDDVHVTPRVQPPESNPNDLIDPSLKTHTKPMKSEVNLVLVPVTITDPMNRLVTGLDKENFQLFEGKDQQEIRHFSSEDAPVSIGVIFDMSGSMVSKIERAREAVIEFFKTANPQDEFFMIAFADRPEEVSDFTSSVEDIQGKLVYTVP